MFINKKINIALSVLLAVGMATPSIGVKAAPHIIPYGVVEAEANFGGDKITPVTEADGVTNSISLAEGGYFLMNDVTFSKGLSKITITLKSNTNGAIEIRKGGKDGESLGNVKFSNTNGAYKKFEASLNNINGTQTIAFVGARGTCTIDNWKAEPSTGATDPGTQSSQPTINPYTAVEAENLPIDAKLGQILGPKGDVVNIAPGKYWAIENVEFSRGLTGFVLQAKTGNGDSVLKVYLDSMTGNALASIPIKSRDEIKQYAARISANVTGKHTVYFVATDAAVTIDKWQVIGGQGTVDPGTTPSDPGTTPSDPGTTPSDPGTTSSDPGTTPSDPGTTTTTVNPYSSVQVEKLSKDELNGAMVPPTAKDAVNIMDGKYIFVNNVNFENGLGGLQVSAKTSVEGAKLDVYIDKVSETPIASVAVAKDSKYVTKGAKFSSNVTGKHTVYLVANGGAITLDAWNAVAGKPSTDPGTTPSDPGTTTPVGDTVSPYDLVEAETLSDKSANVMVTPGGKSVNFAAANTYAVYKNVNFAKGASKFIVNVTSKAAGRMEIWIDGTDEKTGKKVAGVMTGTEVSTVTVNALSEITGVHDVYFVSVMNSNGTTLDSWKVEAAQGTVDPGTTPVDPGTTPVDPGTTTATVNPYSSVQVETLSKDELNGAMVPPTAKDAVNIMDGKYIFVNNVNFENGLGGLQVSAKTSVEGAKLDVYIDKVSGTPVASVEVAKDSKYVTKGAKFSSNVTGKHTVYLVANGGAITLDAWNAIAGKPSTDPGTTPVDPGTTTTTINPYEKVEAKAFTIKEDSNAMITPNGNGMLVNGKGYVVVENVDFKQGASQFEVSVNSSAPSTYVDFYLDEIGDTPLASLQIRKQQFEAYTVDISTAITGKHNVIIAARDKQFTIEYWKAVAGQGTVDPGTTPVDPGTTTPVGDTVSPYDLVEAETLSDKSANVMVTPGGKSVNFAAANTYAVYKNVNFAKGASKFIVNVTSKAAGRMEIWIDGTDEKTGKKVAGVMTGTEVTTVTVNALAEISGVHDVYFVSVMNSNGTTLDSWKVEAGQGTVDPGTTPVDPGTTTPVGDTVDPYTKVEAEAFDGKEGAMATPTKNAVNITADGYIVKKNVSFSKGASGIFISAYAGQPNTSVDVYLDKLDGTKLGTINITASKEFGNAGLKLNTGITGTHDVYFVARKGAVVMDSWYAMAGQGTVDPGTTPVDPGTTTPVGDTVSPYDLVEAETLSDKSANVMVTPGGKSVNFAAANTYAVYKNVNFAKGASKFIVNVTSKAAGRMEIWIDGTDEKTGKKVAGVMTGTEVTTVTVNALAEISGVHDVYFVSVMNSNGTTLDSWKVEAGQGTVDPGTTPVDPGTTTTVNPYSSIQVETLSKDELNGAMVPPTAKDAVNIMDGKYIFVNNVNFENGFGGLQVSAKTSVEGAKLDVYIDKVSGTPVASVEVAKDSKYVTKGAKFSSNVTGKHTVYLVANGGAITLDAWNAVAGKPSTDPGTTPDPGQTTTTSPYNKNEAETSSLSEGAMLNPTKTAVVLSDKGYVLVQDLDFSKGLSGFDIYASASAPKVKLNVYIDDSMTPAGSIDIGTQATTARRMVVNSNITGKHFIYFEAQGGQVVFDAWQALAAGQATEDPGQTTTLRPVIVADPYAKVEAETGDNNKFGAMVTPNKQAVGITANGYIAWNANFTDGVSEIKVKAESSPKSTLEIRLGSPTGEAIGKVDISTSSEKTIKISEKIEGRKNLYFVNTTANTNLIMDYWIASKEQTTVTPPPVVDPPVVNTGMEFTYTTNEWNGGFQVNCNVTNKSGNQVSSWKLKVKKSDINMTQSWCVNVAQEGDYYVITPMSYNSSLSNGQSISFGMIGSGTYGGKINYVIE